MTFHKEDLAVIQRLEVRFSRIKNLKPNEVLNGEKKHGVTTSSRLSLFIIPKSSTLARRQLDSKPKSWEKTSWV